LASGTPVYREGFVFHMPHLSIEVAPECSGIRSCLSMLILTIIAGHMLLKTTWRRIALVLIAIPIMIFKNSIRIATLTLLSIHIDPAIIESRLHREGGIPFFLLALLITYPVLKALMKTEKTEKALSAKPRRMTRAGKSMLREANL
jgi:exosortase